MKGLASRERPPLSKLEREIAGSAGCDDVSAWRNLGEFIRAVVERSGDIDWRLIEGGRGPAKAATVDNLLYALRALKWKTIATPTGDEPARYGLDAPALEVTLLKTDGAELAVVLIGKRDGELAWVKVKAAPVIYAVDAKQLGEPPKVPDDFKG